MIYYVIILGVLMGYKFDSYFDNGSYVCGGSVFYFWIWV